MIILEYKTKTEELNMIEARLKEMVLGHRMLFKKHAKTVRLIEGEEKVDGYIAINKYLDGIQGDLKKWWYCDC